MNLEPARNVRARIAPLLRVAELLAAAPAASDGRFDPDDFMDLSWARHDCPPDLKVFKHVRTRRYLYLDPTGAAYRYIPPPLRDPKLPGSYRHATLRSAIDELALGELSTGADEPAVRLA